MSCEPRFFHRVLFCLVLAASACGEPAVVIGEDRSGDASAATPTTACDDECEDDEPECIDDADCDGDEVCVGGECEECADDADCEAGEVCVASECESVDD